MLFLFLFKELTNYFLFPLKSAPPPDPYLVHEGDKILRHGFFYISVPIGWIGWIIYTSCQLTQPPPSTPSAGFSHNFWELLAVPAIGFFILVSLCYIDLHISTLLIAYSYQRLTRFVGGQLPSKPFANYHKTYTAWILLGRIYVTWICFILFLLLFFGKPWAQGTEQGLVWLQAAMYPLFLAAAGLGSWVIFFPHGYYRTYRYYLLIRKQKQNAIWLFFVGGTLLETLWLITRLALWFTLFKLLGWYAARHGFDLDFFCLELAAYFWNRLTNHL